MKILRYGLVLLVSTFGFAQTPFPMSGGNYSENFADIANWTNNFAAGTGVNRTPQLFFTLLHVTLTLHFAEGMFA